MGLGRAYWGPKVLEGYEESIPINPMRGSSLAVASRANSDTAEAAMAAAGEHASNLPVGSLAEETGQSHGLCQGMPAELGEDEAPGLLSLYNWAFEQGDAGPGEMQSQQQQHGEVSGMSEVGMLQAGSAGHRCLDKDLGQAACNDEAVEEIIACLLSSLESPWCDHVQPFSFLAGAWQVDRIVDQLLEEVVGEPL
jgi:hypothetical protein